MSIPSTRLGDDERLVVSPRRARRMLDCGNTRLYELVNSKAVESFLDGRSRKITVDSIRRYIALRLALAEGIGTESKLARPGRSKKARKGAAT